MKLLSVVAILQQEMFVRMFSTYYGVASFPSAVFPCTMFGICDIS